MKIVLAPYAARLHNNSRNPKNFPHWAEVVHALNNLGYEVIQIGVAGEERVAGVSQFIINWPLRKLRQVLEDADCFMSVDSFLPHFVWAEKLNKRGVVVWGQSDPLIWGHPTNVNLLLSRDHLRPLQFQDWPSATYNADVFVTPEEVVSAAVDLTSNRPAHRNRAVSRSLHMAHEAALASTP